MVTRNKGSVKAKATTKKAKDGAATKGRKPRARFKRGGPQEPKGTPPQLPGKTRKAKAKVNEPIDMRRSPRNSPAKQAPKQADKPVVPSARQPHSPNVESDGGTSSSSDDREDIQLEVAAGDDAEQDKGDDAEQNEGDVSEGAEGEDTSDEEDGPAADIEAPEGSDPECSLKTDTNSTRHRITSSGEDKYWMVHTRKMVANCAPTPNKKFILYLPLSPINTGSSLMIEDDINLQELALTRGGPEKYSTDRAFFFNQHHRKAKAQLNRSIVLALTSPLSPTLFATNVMSGKDGPMTLNPELSHLENIAGLRNLLSSDALYKDEKAHLIWVGLFASGLVFGMNRGGPKVTLDKMIDVDYEAHARYEMISRLSHQGFKHGYKAEDLAERSKGFRLIRKKVRLDRLNNLPEAEAKRLQSFNAADDDANLAQALGSGALADTTDDEDDF